MVLYFVFAVTLLGFTYLNATRVVLSLYALELGAEPFAVGLLAATIYLFPLALSWVVGALSDRWGSRWLLLAGTICATIGALLPYLFHTLPVLFVSAALAGLFLALYNVIVQNLVGVLSKPETRTQNFSNFSLLGATAGFAGPLLAGFSIDHAGHATACLYIMALPIATTALLLKWGRLLPAGSGRPPEASAGIFKTLGGRGMWMMLGISSLMQGGYDFYQFYLPIYGHNIALSASQIGMVLATFAAASFVVRMIMPRLIHWKSEERLLVYCFCIGAAVFALLPFFSNVIVLAAISFLFGLGMGCGQPLTLMLMFSRSPEGRSGETLGLRLTANNVMRTSGPTVFGTVGSVFGLFPVFWLNAVLMGCGAWLIHRVAKRQ